MVALFLNKKILELAARKKIYEFVRKYEGSHFRELERRSGIAASSLKYHLDYLTRHGLLTEKRNGNTLCYFSCELAVDQEILIVLRQKSTRAILLFLVMNKQGSFEEVARFVHLSASTVSWHLKKLRMKHVIETARVGKKTNYKLAIAPEHIMRLLITYRESFLDSLVDKVVALWDI